MIHRAPGDELDEATSARTIQANVRPQGGVEESTEQTASLSFSAVPEHDAAAIIKRSERTLPQRLSAQRVQV